MPLIVIPVEGAKFTDVVPDKFEPLTVSETVEPCVADVGDSEDIDGPTAAGSSVASKRPPA
jgi:hypothetical protein